MENKNNSQYSTLLMPEERVSGNKMYTQAFVDAGIEHIHIFLSGPEQKTLLLKNNDKIDLILQRNNLLELLSDKELNVLITGKMGEIFLNTISNGKFIMPSAALWYLAKSVVNSELKIKDNFGSFGIFELSASGYVVLAVDKKGNLKDDLLVVNPKCGAGAGINISRILTKLDIKPNAVDDVLKDFLGDEGKEKREAVTMRADRCGVFSSSATISDKNQGIPLDYALAVTLKSEVLKACKRMIPGVTKIMLTGRIFMWQYARDCAKDYLKTIGITDVYYDEFQRAHIDGMLSMVESIGFENLKKDENKKLSRVDILPEYPSFTELHKKFTDLDLYKRIDRNEVHDISFSELENTPVNIGIDAGSTMAKIVICDARDNRILRLGSCDNHGDTVETIKYIFSQIKDEGCESLNIQHIGLTGSGRYQVQKVLGKIYPSLTDRIFTLVENYAHAHGSIAFAKENIEQLKHRYPDVNQEFYALVDIGGEDTKVSVIALKKEELFDNAMNVKCSAGTGSLMDTLKSLFGIDSISEACNLAYSAKKAYEINATCAVFLMENAKKMQADGYPKDDILASCNFAIVENMARTLWNSLNLPGKAVVMLHGQTMQSDPLPLAVTNRIQEISRMHCVVPPHPGHRACLGLVLSIKNKEIIQNNIKLEDLINTVPEKRIFFCTGAVCNDKEARCARTSLTLCGGAEKVNVKLGGCTLVNNIISDKGNNSRPLSNDPYREIWRLADELLPRSEAEDRLIIPKSFAVSSNAFLISKIFELLGFNVHVDNVKESDIHAGQPEFSVDVCAPLIGATGQYERLAREKHGMILVPQIDYLPTNGKSEGKTCTTNQGGVLIAMHFAKIKYPESKFFNFVLNLKNQEASFIADRLHIALKGLFHIYKKNISRDELFEAISKAIELDNEFKNKLANKAADLIEFAIADQRNITIVMGREYLLNPGIYDSHAGKLLRDKGIVAIPSYVIDTELDSRFGYLYWKNAHELLTKIDAVTNNTLHLITKNERLKLLFSQIEGGFTQSSINSVQVSTFRCGPDTILIPFAEEVTKKKPSLIIQSDAVIKELAHLENRVNTFISQIEKKLHETYAEHDFDIELLNDFEFNKIDPLTDVVYFPTMHDNRIVTSVFRGAGITTIDNFVDADFDIKQKIMLGRRYTGDSICAPMAGVFADILLAVEDFKKRKSENDPVINGKSRLLFFDSKGTGPCRQGQYVEVHKLLLYQKNKNKQSANGSLNGNGSCSGPDKTMSDFLKLMVSREENGYDPGLEEWALIQSFQGLIMQGIFNSILLKSGQVCQNLNEFEEFKKDYLQLKNDIYDRMELSIKPKKMALKMTNLLSEMPGPIVLMLKTMVYGVHNNNGYRKLLKKFSAKWFSKERLNHKTKLKVHIEGEFYMRIAQFEDIFKELIDAIGFGSFKADCSPMWTYFEYSLENTITESKENMALKSAELGRCKESKIKKVIINEIESLQKKINYLNVVKKVFRSLFIEPLYKAAVIDIPHETSHILEKSRQLNKNLKPEGELPLYVGEAISKIEDGIDLFLNVSPESCMVSAMGQSFTAPIHKLTGKNTRIQDLFSINGEINREKLQLSILRTLGPEKYYTKEVL